MFALRVLLIVQTKRAKRVSYTFIISYAVYDIVLLLYLAMIIFNMISIFIVLFYPESHRLNLKNKKIIIVRITMKNNNNDFNNIKKLPLTAKW